MTQRIIANLTTTRRSLLALAVVLVLGSGLLSSTPVAHAEPSPPVDLATTWVSLPAFSQAVGVSDSGIVVGYRPTGIGRERTAVRFDLQTGVSTDLGTLGGGQDVTATAVNEAGVIVGYSSTDVTPDDPPTHPFVWDPTTQTMLDVGTLTGAPTCAGSLEDVNESGIAVGSSCYVATPSVGEPMHAIRYDIATDEMVDLGTLGGDKSWAMGIADDGAIVGRANLAAGGPVHAFYRHAGTGTMLDLGTLPGDKVSWATAINPAGTFVVGWSAPDGTGDGVALSRGFVYDVAAGTMTDIGTLGGAQSVATDINDAGLVVGMSKTLDGSQHGIYFDTGTSSLIDADTRSVSTSFLHAVNSSGLAVGRAFFMSNFVGTGAALTRWTFGDVPPWHVFGDDIEWVATEGIVHGFPDDTYRPALPVTRQAMAAFLHRLAGSPAFTPPTTPTFIDVGLDDPFYAEIEWLAAESIATGYDDDGYHPVSDITRQAMAAFLYRLAGEPAFTPPDTSSFPDVPTTHPFFTEIEWMAAEGITAGFDDGTFRPGTLVTRQTMAAFMHRYADGPGAP